MIIMRSSTSSSSLLLRALIAANRACARTSGGTPLFSAVTTCHSRSNPRATSSYITRTSSSHGRACTIHVAAAAVVVPMDCIASNRHDRCYRNRLGPCQRLMSTSTSAAQSQSSSSSSSSSQWSDLVSKRDMADLEDRVCRAVSEAVVDPILHQPLSQLNWLVKRIVASTSSTTTTPASPEKTAGAATNVITLQMLLRPPSILHPALDELKQQIRTVALAQVQAWLVEKQLDHLVRTVNDNEADLATATTRVASVDHTLAKLTVDVNVEALPANRPVPMMARLLVHDDDQDELLSNLGPGLQSVAHYVAVYSCKGGVGKSTVAVNLAYELAQLGGRIGLLDLDLYGPSLPVLVQPTDVTIRRSPLGSGVVYPIVHDHVKLLSLGFVNTHSGVPGSGPENGAAVMKGPMAVKVVSQLLKGTDWGDLDVLILDLPPGTGDVQLAVLQQLQLSGAVAVTTPSKLAVTDTRKGMEMFTSLGVPTLAVVENLSYFRDDTGKTHYPFGRGFVADGDGADLTKGVQVVRLPISIAANDANETGVPLTLQRPSNATVELDAYRELANAVSKELLLLQYGSPEGKDNKQLVVFDLDPDHEFDVSTVTLSLDKSKAGSEKLLVRLLSDSTAIQLTLLPSHLRSRNPKTGDLLSESPFLNLDGSGDEDTQDAVVTKTRKRSPSIIPTKVERRGRYGFAVEWGDGATVIYSMLSLARAAGGIVRQ